MYRYDIVQLYSRSAGLVSGPTFAFKISCAPFMRAGSPWRPRNRAWRHLELWSPAALQFDHIGMHVIDHDHEKWCDSVAGVGAPKAWRPLNGINAAVCLLPKGVGAGSNPCVDRGWRHIGDDKKLRMSE